VRRIRQLISAPAADRDRFRDAFIRTYKPEPNRGRRDRERQGLGAAQDGRFDLELVFAPDGIETFEDAWRRRVEVEGFPVCHLDDIIASKVATNRVKDRESLPRLRVFLEYWRRQE
jgi:hypothetical protein